VCPSVAACRRSAKASSPATSSHPLSSSIEEVGSSHVSGRLTRSTAARLLGAAANSRDDHQAPLVGPVQRLLQGSVAATRAALGEDAFAAAWAEGRNLSLDEAVAMALAQTPKLPIG
jgi:hypothetical protein